MIARILYATDFSAASLAAWPCATELARACNAELVILHVVPPLTAPPEGLPLAPCPVVTVGPALARTARLGPLIYPTDFSPTAQEAWPVAQDLAIATGAQLVLLHVMPEVPEDPRVSPSERAKLEAGYRRRAEQSVGDLLARSRIPRPQVQTVLAHGVAEEQIVNQAVASGAGLIVMGTHGWSGPIRWALGSIAHRVIRTAPCPVLTIGPQSQREEARRVS